jgi:hypothetical protein
MNQYGIFGTSAFRNYQCVTVSADIRVHVDRLVQAGGITTAHVRNIVRQVP